MGEADDKMRPMSSAEPIGSVDMRSTWGLAARGARRSPLKAVFWTYFAVAFGCGVLAEAVFFDRTHEERLLFSAAVLAVVTAGFGVVHGRTLWPQMSRLGLKDPHAWLGLVLLLPVLAVNFIYHEAVAFGWGGRGVQGGVQEEATHWMLFALCVVPAVTEEVAFRGLVQRWVSDAVGEKRGLLVAAALFAALHLSLVSAPYLFVLGILLGVVRKWTGSLWPVIVLHFLHNVVAVLFLHF